VIYELLDNPNFFQPMQARYVEYIAEKTRMLCERASLNELFIGNEYSELPLLSPQLWQEWDYPVLKTFCDVAARYGRPTHWHQHGSVTALLPDFARSGLTILCPLERPPAGDVNLAQVKRLYGDRLCLKGNVETNLLLNGTPDQVEAQVKECIEAAAAGGGYILGTGDQVARDTPFETIRALVEAGLEYGQY
jgi:uroporphyrinogen-III decarboxylase